MISSLDNTLKELTDASESPDKAHDVSFIAFCHEASTNRFIAARNVSKKSASDFFMIAAHYVYDFCIQKVGDDDGTFPDAKAEIVLTLLRQCHGKRQQIFSYDSGIQKGNHVDRCREFEQRVHDFCDRIQTLDIDYYMIVYEIPHELMDGYGDDGINGLAESQGIRMLENISTTLDTSPGISGLVDVIKEKYFN